MWMSSIQNVIILPLHNGKHLCMRVVNVLFYKTINNDLRMQQYLLTLPFSQRKIMTRFRVSNHRLPVELLRYTGIDREQRVCHKCNENVIGDEIHYLLFCPYFKNQKQSLIGLYLSNPPSINNIKYMFNSPDYNILKNIVKYIKCVMNQF